MVKAFCDSLTPTSRALVSGLLIVLVAGGVALVRDIAAADGPEDSRAEQADPTDES